MSIVRVVAATLALTVSGTVGAIPITFSFTGTVTQVPADDPGGAVGFGTAISGDYTFESTAADGIANGSQGSYAAFGPPYGLEVQIGSLAFSLSDFLNVGVSNDLFGTDQYGVLALGGAVTVSMLFEDFSGLSLASDALPVGPPPLAGFAIRGFQLYDTSAGDVQIEGQIDSLVCVAGCNIQVPEPGSLGLLFAGLVAATACRRRFRFPGLTSGRSLPAEACR